MSVETKIKTAFNTYLAGKTTITAITGLSGVRIEEDYSSSITYPCLLIDVEPAYDIAGFEATSQTLYKETRVRLTCETYKAEDLNASSISALYDALIAVLNISTILSALDTASGATPTLSFLECKIMPEEGIFTVTDEIRQRILSLRIKVREIV